MRAWTWLLLANAGCAVQMGGHGGVTPSEPVRATHGVQLSAYTAPWTPGSGMVHLGVETSAEVEHRVGSEAEYLGTDFTMGAQIGYAHWFDNSRLSLQPHANFGTALFDSAYDGYAGITMAMPIELGPIRDVTDMNHAFQLVARRLSLVPYGRWRFTWSDGAQHHNASLGLALRARLSTDLL